MMLEEIKDNVEVETEEKLDEGDNVIKEGVSEEKTISSPDDNVNDDDIEEKEIILEAEVTAEADEDEDEDGYIVKGKSGKEISKKEKKREERRKREEEKKEKANLPPMDDEDVIEEEVDDNDVKEEKLPTTTNSSSAKMSKKRIADPELWGNVVGTAEGNFKIGKSGEITEKAEAVLNKFYRLK